MAAGEHDEAAAAAPDQGITTTMSKRARPFLDLADALRQDGIQSHITIPQIAVMGDQSSGKSSVLQAISGIEFPRGSGLVTRCATQVTMSRGAEWEAELRVGGLEAGDGPVHKVAKNEQHKVTELIEQLTTELCGAASAGGFCKDKWIEVKLVAPDMPDLTIIDLPGIVKTNTNGQTKEVIEQVDQLLKHYLEQPRTIILAVIKAPDDIATSDIVERATVVDPHGERTVGVLTMPDLVNPGAEDTVLGVLSNKTKPLKNGYFMLKNPSQEELKGDTLTRNASQAKETQWFESDPRATAYKGQSARLGVGQLETALTELLVNQIEKAIPTMGEEVDQQLKRIEDQLESLGRPPPPAAEHRRFAMETVRNVVRDLRLLTSSSDVSGSKDTDSIPNVLRQENRARKAFVKDILGTRPGFNGENDTFDVEVTKVDVGYPRKTLKDGVAAKKVGDVLEGKSWNEYRKRSVTKIGETIPADYESQGFTEVKVIRMTSYFRADLAERIERGRGRELPGFMSFDVFSALIAEYMQLWEEPTAAFQTTVADALKNAAVSTVLKHTSQLPELTDALTRLVKAEVSTMATEATGQLGKLLLPEMTMPSTENHYLFDTLNKIRNDRVAKKIKELADSSDNIKADQVLAMLQSTIGNDSNESQEVQDMIDILSSYWKLAMKRYVDSAGMAVTAAFTAASCISTIEATLSDVVLSYDDTELDTLLAQSPEVEQTRRDLEAARGRMSAAKERIEGFMHGRPGRPKRAKV